MKAKKFGFVFGETLETSRKKKAATNIKDLKFAESWGDQYENERGGKFKISAWRLVPIYFFLFSGALILFGRAVDLQLIRGGLFLGRAEGNRIRLIINHAPRGAIFDRNGKVLAQNLPGFTLVLDPQGLPKEKINQVAAKLSSILNIPEVELLAKFKNVGDKLATLVTNLPIEKALAIDAESNNLPGVQLEVNPIRDYPYKEVTASILGYTAEADSKDIQGKIAIPYNLGDQVGKFGVEQSMEDTLRGIDGYDLETITAQGEKKGGIYKTEPAIGQNITLSIDIDLQKFVYNTLSTEIRNVGATSGSAVVLDPSTGEILALVSIPSFDDNLFAKGISEQEYSALINSSLKPLLNRAIGASYPPGSTFKMVSGTAGLETGTIKKDTKINDLGFITLGSHIFQNWLWIDHHQTEGQINIVRAIARSTDTFFYQIGQRMGEKPIQDWAKTFGLGKTTGIELPGEEAGLVPTEEWKLQTKKEPWYPGDTLNLSIGQGDLLATPLQLSMVTACFANGGKLLSPTILKDNGPNVIKENFLKKETIDTIREGLYQDNIGDGNVGWLFGNFKIPTAGKTGSAESGQVFPHAWYTAMAPYPNAKIVATVQVENAGHGSEISAPVVKQIFEWWFSNRK